MRFLKEMKLNVLLFLATVLSFVPVGFAQYSGDDPDRVLIGRSGRVEADEHLEEVVVVGGAIHVEGKIEELIAVGSAVHLGPSARITKEFVTVGSSVEGADPIKLPVKQTQVSLPSMSVLAWPVALAAPFMAWWLALGSAISTGLLAWLVGLLYLHFFPTQHQKAVDRLAAHPGGAWGWGALAHLALVPGAILLILTIVGIILLPVYFIGFGLLMLLGFITAADVVGARLGKQHVQGNAQRLGLGVLVLTALRILPWLGGFIVFMVTIAGLGAVIRAFGASVRKGRPTRQVSADHHEVTY